MPQRKITALVAPPSPPLAMKTVIGRRIATPLVPPRPGSTPMTRPRKQPIARSMRLKG
jgi:hypothetical protein